MTCVLNFLLFRLKLRFLYCVLLVLEPTFLNMLRLCVRNVIKHECNTLKEKALGSKLKASTEQTRAKLGSLLFSNIITTSVLIFKGVFFRVNIVSIYIEYDIFHSKKSNYLLVQCTSEFMPLYMYFVCEPGF